MRRGDRPTRRIDPSPSKYGVAAGDNPQWQRAFGLLVAPIESAQRSLREISRAVHVDRLRGLETQQFQKDITNRLVKEDDSRLFEVSGSVWAGVEQRRFEALRQPSFLLRSPSPGAFKSGMSEVLDRSPLLLFPDGEILTMLLRRKQSREVSEFPEALTNAVVGCDQVFTRSKDEVGIGQLEAVRAKLFTTCTRAQLQQALRSEDESLGRILRNSLLVDVDDAPPAVNVDEQWLRPAYALYRTAVKNVIGARRAGNGMCFSPGAAASAHLASFTRELVDWLEKLPDTLRPFYRHTLSLAPKVFWALLATRPAVDRGDEELCIGAIRISAWAIRRQRKLLEQLLEDAAQSEHEQARERMIEKLRGRPCHRRQLLRRYHRNQRREAHDPILLELVKEGRVRLDHNGLIGLAEEMPVEELARKEATA